MQSRRFKLRRVVVLATLISCGQALAGGDAPQGRIDYRPASETGAPAWIAYAPDGPLRFKATVAGRTIEAMADTGATFTTLDRRFAETLGSTGSAAIQAIPVTGIGGPATAYPGPTIDLTFPSYTIANLPTAILDLAPLHAAAGHPIDVMLGLDVLGSGALELELADHRWRLWPSGIQWPDAAQAPLHRSDSGNYAFVAIAVETRPLRLVIDTGLTNGLTLSATVAGTIDALTQGRRTSLATQGVNGVAVESVVIPAHLRFGSVELSNVPVHFGGEGADAPPEGFDGVIGLGLLRRVHVVMDFPAGRLFYAADDREAVPPVRSTIGLQVLWDGGGALVRHVMDNSPAAAAGWKAGDRICAVDDTPVADRGESRSPYPWSVRAPGTRLTFRLCDGTERSLVAQDFY